MDRVRILFIDHSPAFVHGLLSYFSKLNSVVEYDLVNKVSSGIALMQKGSYDIILLDTTLGDFDVERLFVVLSNKTIKARIAITAIESSPLILSAVLQLKASCVLNRNAKREEVLEGCKALLNGSSYYSRVFISGLL
jgi:DNA-binding NarL/FixJ family response regulator